MNVLNDRTIEVLTGMGPRINGLKVSEYKHALGYYY